MHHDVFISFSFAHYDMAQQIVNGLQSRHGIKCWICKREDSDSNHVYSGTHFRGEIVSAIEACQVVVLVQSKEVFISREIQQEINIAFEDDKLIIPFRIDDSKITGQLRYNLTGTHEINGREPTFDERIDELASSIKRHLRSSNAVSEALPTGTLASTPFSINEIFVGREQLITTIHEAYSTRNVVFLHGMGGIGKSGIAKAYAKEFSQEYDTVVFARFTTSLAELIANDSYFNVAGVSRRTHADNTLQTDEEYALDKLAAIQRDSTIRTLIIIDNFDVTTDPLLHSITVDCPYRLLITTRCKPEIGKYHTITVPELDDDALRRLFIAYADPDTTPVNPKDPSFPELFDITHRHTLTIELIAKYFCKNGMEEISEIVDVLKNSGLAALSEDNDINGYSRIRELFRLTRLTDAEIAFLRCLSLMPPSGIEQRFFRQWCGSIYGARSSLMSLSLIQMDTVNRRLSLHPVIREIIINELKPTYEQADCKHFIDVCTLQQDDRFSGTMWEYDYSTKLTYLSCYKSIAAQINPINETNFPVFYHIAKMYCYIEDYPEAIRFLNSLYASACTLFGRDSYQAMCVLCDIGWKNSNCRFYTEAVQHMEIAAKHFIASSTPHGSITMCGEIYTYLYAQNPSGDFLQKAKYYLDKSAELGDELTRMRSVSYGYFKLCCLTGEYQKAEEYLSAFNDSYHGSRAPVDYSYADYNVGRLEYYRGNYNEAIIRLNSAYEILATYFSVKNFRIIDILEFLSDASRKAGKLQDALDYAQRAVEIAETLYLDDHPILQRLKEMAAPVSGITDISASIPDNT